MEDFEDQSRRDGRQRVDAAAVWTATAGALVCSVVIFLATNWPSPEPVAEPIPSAEWRFPLNPSATVDPGTPGDTFAAVAPLQAGSPGGGTGTGSGSAPPRGATTTPGATGTAPQASPSSSSAVTHAPTTPPVPGVRVRAVGAGKCLDVPNSTTTPGTQLQIWDCSGQANQAWARTPSGQLTVALSGTTECMDAYGQRTNPGTQVDIHPCNGQANQLWRFNPDGTIIGVQSGLCLDVTGESTADGAKVELWTCNGQTNQRWTLG